MWAPCQCSTIANKSIGCDPNKDPTATHNRPLRDRTVLRLVRTFLQGYRHLHTTRYYVYLYEQ